jgi:hypothetical protein
MAAPVELHNKGGHFLALETMERSSGPTKNLWRPSNSRMFLSTVAASGSVQFLQCQGHGVVNGFLVVIARGYDPINSKIEQGKRYIV